MTNRCRWLLITRKHYFYWYQVESVHIKHPSPYRQEWCLCHSELSLRLLHGWHIVNDDITSHDSCELAGNIRKWCHQFDAASPIITSCLFHRWWLHHQWSLAAMIRNDSPYWACCILDHGITSSKHSAVFDVFEEHIRAPFLDFFGMFWGLGILKGAMFLPLLSCRWKIYSQSGRRCASFVLRSSPKPVKRGQRGWKDTSQNWACWVR